MGPEIAQDILIPSRTKWWCELRCRRGEKMERSALHLSILIHAAVYRVQARLLSSEWFRLIPSVVGGCIAGVCKFA